jgi:hypothetical protein
MRTEFSMVHRFNRTSDGINRRLKATNVNALLAWKAAAKDVASTRETPGGFSMKSGIPSGSKEFTSAAVADGCTVHTIASGRASSRALQRLFDASL